MNLHVPARPARLTQGHAERRAEFDLHLSRFGYQAFGCIFFLAGILACYVIGAYLYVALNSADSSGLHKLIVMATAALFVAAGVLSFLFSSLLPERKWQSEIRQFRLFGWGLVLFEIATLFGAQMNFIEAEIARSTAAQARIELLAQKLERHNSLLSAAATTATTQGSSRFHSVTNSAADLIRRSMLAEGQTDAVIDELARLQSQHRPPLTDAYGDKAKLWALLRAIFLSTINIMMFSAAGKCWRAARGVSRVDPPAPARAAPHKSRPASLPQPRETAPRASSDRLQAGATTPALPGAWSMSMVGTLGATAFGIGSLTSPPVHARPTLPALAAQCGESGSAGPSTSSRAAAKPPAPADAVRAVTEPVHEAAAAVEGPDAGQRPAPPAVTMSVQPSLEATPAGWGAPVQRPGEEALKDSPPASHRESRGKASLPRKTQAARPANPGHKIDTGVGELDGHRYRRVRAAILAGACGTSVHDIQKQFGGSKDTVRGYQAQLVEEGLLERVGDWITAPYRVAERYRRSEEGS